MCIIEYEYENTVLNLITVHKYERQEGIDRWNVQKEILETVVCYERIQ